jgi:cell division protein FtsN
VAAVVHTASGKSSFYLQAGSYLTEARAGQAASALDRLGARVMSGVVDGHAVYRVRIGPFLNMQQANTAFGAAQSLGHSDLKIVME